MRKKPTRKRPYFTKESSMTAILRDASGKMHRGILFDRRLVTKFKSQFQRGFTKMVVTRAGRFTGKNNGFPFLDTYGHFKNTHKNPKFGRVRQVPIRELG